MGGWADPSFTVPLTDTKHERSVILLEISIYSLLYNKQINARALIGQSAMVHCASRPMEK